MGSASQKLPPLPSPEEQEQQRCCALLRDDGPEPRPLLPAERGEIGRFVRAHNSLGQFRQNGIERFLGNASKLPDGRALFLFAGDPVLPVSISFLVWGSRFGPCLRGIVRLRARLCQTALVPGSVAFEALRSKKVVLGFIRSGYMETAFELDYNRRSDQANALDYMLNLTEDAYRRLKDDERLYMMRGSYAPTP